MQFFSQLTSYDNAIQLAKTTNEEMPDHKTYYNRGLHFGRTITGLQTESDRATYNQLMTEWDWYNHGKPYYNIHPGLVNTFGKASFNFPCKYIKFPFKSLAVCFAKDDPAMLLPDGKHRLRTALIYSGECSETHEVAGLLDKNPSDKMFVMWLDFGEKTEVCVGMSYGKHQRLVFHVVENWIMTYRNFYWKDGEEKVEERLSSLPVHMSALQGLQIPEAYMTLALKLILSVAFLAQDESPIIVPHLLDGDMPKLRSPVKPQEIADLHEKAAKARGSKGFMVGCDAMFEPKLVGPAEIRNKSEPTGRELQYAHIVGGYWKLVRFGPKMEQGRVRWIMPHLRGEGKPFKPNG